MTPADFAEMVARLQATGELEEPDPMDTQATLDRLIYTARKVTGRTRCWLHGFNYDRDCNDCSGLETVAIRKVEHVNGIELCSDCPPFGYPTDKTRCDECPRLTEKRDATRPCTT
jgi:hypothetical protein